MFQMPTTAQCFSVSSERLTITNRPYLTATWRQDVTLAEINAQLPPWLALTVTEYAKRAQAFIGINGSTALPMWFYTGRIALIDEPPPANAGPEWYYRSASERYENA